MEGNVNIVWSFTQVAITLFKRTQQNISLAAIYLGGHLF